MDAKKILGLFCTMLMITIVLFIPAVAVTEDNSVQTSASRSDFRAAYGWPKLFGSESNTGYSASFGPMKNDTLWNYTTEGEIYASPTIGEGRLFIASWDQHLYALDAETGTFLWKFDTGDYVYSSPTYYNGKVYIGTGIEIGANVMKLFAVNVKTGTLEWEHQFMDNVYGSAVVYDDVLYVGCGDGVLYALDPDGKGDGTSTVLWKFDTGGEIWSTPAIFNNHIYITSNVVGKLFKINLTTHEEVWNFTDVPHLEGLYSSPAVDEDGRVFFGSAVQPQGYFYAVDDSGNEIWNIETGTSRYGVCATPAIHNGIVFIGSNNGKMYALDADTGDEKWTYATKDTYQGVYSSATIAGGYLYFGSSDGNLYCLAEDNGDEVWIFPTGGGEYGVVSTPAVLGGRVYFGSNDWEVYAIGSPRTGEIEIELTSDSEIIGPGEDTTITVKTFNGSIPLGWIEVRLTALSGTLTSLDSRSESSGGTRTSILIDYTDLVGVYRCKYTAPNVQDYTNVLIEVEASGQGLITNSSSLNLIVNPNPQLEMSMTPTKSEYYIGEPIAIELNITAGGKPVDSVVVNYEVTYDSESITDYGIADFQGIYNLVFTAPSVTAETTVSFSATATKKPGFISATENVSVTVLPQTAYELNITISADKAKVASEKSTGITITVTNQTTGDPLSSVSLTISITQGTLDKTDGVTDSKGQLQLTYTAPSNVIVTTVFILKVKASMINFNDRTEQYDITVIPEDADTDGDGKDDEEPSNFFASPGFIAGVLVIIIVIIVALIVLLQAKKKAGREREEEERKEEPKKEEEKKK